MKRKFVTTLAMTLVSAVLVAPVAAAAIFGMGSKKGTEEDRLISGEVRRVVIGLDLSASNPLVDDRLYARKAAERVAKSVDGMLAGSEVIIRTFGAYEASHNPFSYTGTISSRNRPEKLKNQIYQLISNVPQLIAKGVLESQNETNIIAFMEDLSVDLDCRDMYTKVILLTDGVEDSDYANLSQRGGKLPMPEEKYFRRCKEMEILGIGRGLDSPLKTRRLKDQWEAWSKAAGFKKFRAQMDW